MAKFNNAKLQLLLHQFNTKQKYMLRLTELTYGYQWGRVDGRDRLGVWEWHVKKQKGLISLKKKWMAKQQSPTVSYRAWGRKWQPTPVFLPGESYG